VGETLPDAGELFSASEVILMGIAKSTLDAILFE
jgi:hypothetical protein